MNLFNKAALFGDIHFGEKLDSEEHNRDCLDFVEWFCEQTIERRCDVVIFMGDWYHNRVRTENRTAHYSKLALEQLDGLGLPIYWILGNHEIYFKHNRDIHSLPQLPLYQNFILIDKITQLGDVVFSPWLVGDEKDDLVARHCRYIFGHFELPFFLMNQVIEKRYDGEGLHIDDFVHCKAVYSGHFHKRQLKLNRKKIPIYYIGNCFGHNFNDVNDPERGMAMLSWGDTEPAYLTWPGAPTYHRHPISVFINQIENGTTPGSRSHIELVDDIGLQDDALQSLKQVIEARSVRIIPKPLDLTEGVDPLMENRKYKSLDHLVTTQIPLLNYGDKYDPKILLDLYTSV